MPLDEEKWASADHVKSDTTIVLDFLRDHPGEAFNVKEITLEVSDFDQDDKDVASSLNLAISAKYMRTIVETLLERGEIEERLVRETSDSGATRNVSYFRHKGDQPGERRG